MQDLISTFKAFEAAPTGIMVEEQQEGESSTEMWAILVMQKVSRNIH